MPIPVISELPPAPILGTDIEEDFSDKVDAIFSPSGLPNFIDELNDFGPDLVDAAAAAGYSSVSTTSIAIGSIGQARTFTVETGKMYVAGAFVMIADAAAPTTNRMLCEVTSYDISDGELVVSIVYPWGSGTKTAWVISLSGPPGEATNFTDMIFVGTPTEEEFTIPDGESVDIDPANGSIQYWTLGANRTPTAANFANGQSVVLMIADGASAYAVTWSTIGVVWDGAIEPTLPTSGYRRIVLDKSGGVIRGTDGGVFAS